MRRIAVTLAVVALLFGAGAAWADWDVDAYHDANNAYGRGDYETAFREYLRLAEKGNPWAMSNLGSMYARGEGVPQNDKEAIKWYGVASAVGILDAQFSLGYMFANGRGVSQNHTKAVTFYRMAAEQGHAKAQDNLGFMYYVGEGVPEDYVKAHMWWSLAKAQGHEKAATKLGILKKQMTPAQVAKAQELAAEMWEKINN